MQKNVNIYDSHRSNLQWIWVSRLLKSEAYCEVPGPGDAHLRAGLIWAGEM